MQNIDTGADLPRQRSGRRIIALDGEWGFSFIGPHGSVTDGEITVPGLWQAQFPALCNSSGTGTYRRAIETPELAPGQRLVVVFEGIFHLATVAVDGHVIATNRNGWTPFEVDITAAVERRRHFTLIVTATVPDDRDYANGGLGALLHGKQDWYGLQGGIWKSVRLEVREAVHLASLRVAADTNLRQNHVRINAALSRTVDAELRVTVLLRERPVAERTFRSATGTFSASLELEEAELWSPDAPNLYAVRVVLLAGGTPVDTIHRPLGFRRFERRDGRLILNGEPFYMIGALDQDWYPEAECRGPDTTFLEDRFRKAKALGFNTLRCHVKIPDPLYFDLADRLGLIVWLDMPYPEFLTPDTRADLVETFRAAVANHGHHPSIAVWTIINEGWGIDLDDNPDDRRWLSATFDRLKPLVPGSLLVDNSACFPRNYHLKTDIEDFHWYNSWPSQNDQFEATVDAFAARAPWTFSPHQDADRSGEEPLVVSEFGVWGLPHPRDILDNDGSEPWWFESGHDWNRGAAYPHGMETRFRDAGLAPVFGNLDGFVDAAQEAQFRGLKHQIETLRYAEPVSGYVVTELNDTQWEANGLMDARNNPRAFADRLAALQTPWLVVARAERTALSGGEAVHIRARLAGSGRLPDGAALSWSFGGERARMVLPASANGSGEVAFRIVAPRIERIGIERLEIAVHDEAGRLLSANRLEFCVVPYLPEAPALSPLDETAAQLLADLSWPGGASGRDAPLLATRLTAPVREALLQGRKVLLVASGPDALTDPERGTAPRDLVNFPKMEIVKRDGTAWDGRWMGAFSWRRTDGPWAGFPNGPMLDEHWNGLLPKFVLTGFRSTAFNGLVDAGVAVGWLHRAAAFSKRSFLGKGWMTVTTFDFTSREAQQNPLAPYVLRALAGS